MNYNQFVQAVYLKVKEAVSQDTRVTIHSAEKNNGVCRTGLMITRQGINVSPTIYLEEYFQQYERGMDVDEIVQEVMELYEKIRFQKPWKEQKFSGYEDVKEKIIYRLISRTSNQEMLKHVPYVPYLDLAVVFYVLLEATEYGTATILIKNEHLEKWNVTEEELYWMAGKNTPQLLPYEFQTMGEVLNELHVITLREPQDILYVLSNQIRSFGAAAILYPGRLDQIGRFLGENYYVLPSSVHEVIMIPESKAFDREELKEMVTDINRTQVGAEEVLSNHVYYYNREEGILSC